MPKNFPLNQSKELNDPESINQCLIKRNLAHINQVQGTPCIIGPLSILLKNNSFTEVGKTIL